MRALVTGGAGFIGSHLVQELLWSGDTVRVLDNFSTGKRENLAGFKGDLEVIAGDLRNTQVVKEVLHGMDVAFHLAAFVSVPQSLQDPLTCFSINVTGTVTLLEAARLAGLRKVVLASSTAVYGNTAVFPTDEQVPLRPLSPYALSKQVNELYAFLYTSMGLPVVSLRYFNVYGPRQRADSDYAAAIPIFLRSLLSGKGITIFGDGKQSRDFIFVKDVVHANLLAAKSTVAGEVFNICTGQEISLVELLEVMEEVMSYKSKVTFDLPRPGDIYRSVGSSERASAILGFQATTSLVDGLTQTAAWLKGS